MIPDKTSYSETRFYAGSVLCHTLKGESRLLNIIKTSQVTNTSITSANASYCMEEHRIASAERH